MDQAHLQAAIPYVDLNPVRARLAGRDDEIVTVAPVLERTGDFAAYLGEAKNAERIVAIPGSRGCG